MSPATSPLLHRDKPLESVQENAPKSKGERQLLNLTSDSQELCDLRLDT